MTRITKRGITQELDDRLLGILLKAFKNTRTKKDLTEFLNQFLTPEEQIMIKKRLAIILSLQECKRTKEITEILDVSRATISFVKKGLKRPPRKQKQVEGRITKKDLKDSKTPPWYPTYKGKGRWSFLYRL